MKKLTLYFILPSYDEQDKYIKLLFEEQPKLKKKKSIYKSTYEGCQEYGDYDFDDDYFINHPYLATIQGRQILTHPAVITFQSLKTLKDLQNFVDKYKIEYILCDRFDKTYRFSDFINH